MSNVEMNGLPKMIMMVGIPGSGKSTLAKHIYVDDYGNVYFSAEVCTENVPSIHSSDALREELFGDANHQADNIVLFTELHRRIKADLRSGKDVIYDATNINKKLRISFLNELKCITCIKICISVMTPYDVCIENNRRRDRVVPEHAIRKMYMNWQPPHFNEGFDTIHFAFPCQYGNYGNYTLNHLREVMDGFDQENEHHALTLGAHCQKAAEYCYSLRATDRNLVAAALLHDVGKLYTKVRINSRGIDDGNCHYYQHHCVGAYVAMFYLSNWEYTIEDQCDIINMIYYHMHPYMAWKQSEKAKNRDRQLLGEKLFDQIMVLHEADLNAH